MGGGTAVAAFLETVREGAVSVYRMLADLGYVAGPIALGLAADLFGPDPALAGTAVLLVAVAVLFARLAPEAHRG